MSDAVLTKVDSTLQLDLSKCRGMEFQDVLNKARAIPGRRFDYDRKLWLFPGDDPAVAERLIITVKPKVDDELKDWVVASKMQAEADLTTPMPDDADVQVPWGRQRMSWQPEVVNDEQFEGLKDYQRTAVDLLARVHRAILADDMGLGKTLEAISTVEEYILRNPLADGTERQGPRLVVAPSSVKGTWVRELTRWLKDPPIQLIDGYNPEKRHKQVIQGIKDNAWVITNWEQLRVQAEVIKIKRRSGAVSKKKVVHMKEPLFQAPWLADAEPTLDDLDWRAVGNALKRGEGGHWLAIIADEAHRAKNRKAAQSIGLHRTVGEVMLAMTGTPILNSPDELWSLLHWLYPDEFGDSLPPTPSNPHGVKKIAYGLFYDSYVDYYENEEFGGKIITGVKNPDALRFLLRDRMVRRTAEQVRKGSLPGKRRVYFDVPLHPKQKKLYDEAEKQMWLEVYKEAAAGDKGAQDFVAAAEAGAPPSRLYKISNGAARMVRLLQIIENTALLGGDDCSAVMDDFVEKYQDAGGRPWVVGCKHVESCELLAGRLRKVGVKVAIWHGKVAPEDRTKIEDRFQKGEIDVIVGTTKSMMEGVTLTRSHLMYSLTPEWVPAWNEQWEARCANRTGQQNFTLIYRPQAPDTVVTDNLRPTLGRKEQIVRTVVMTDNIEEVTT